LGLSGQSPQYCGCQAIHLRQRFLDFQKPFARFRLPYRRALKVSISFRFEYCICRALARISSRMKPTISSAARPPSAARQPRQRSAVTNGRKLLLNGDGNSAYARRYRDLLDNHVAELGGAAVLSAAQLSLCRRAASIEVMLEEQEGAAKKGPAGRPRRFHARQLAPAPHIRGAELDAYGRRRRRPRRCRRRARATHCSIR
jgi:hypothetical protein